ncbi:plexin-A1-like isoform X2 [Montipora foliosa]|uniref:plexin-A1-like isoform X2 n=2 Tax=Montipora foliosa TaxID=591990 RepID=UPI0035F217C6
MALCLFEVAATFKIMDTTAMCVWNIVVVFFSSLPCTIYCKYHELKLGGDLVNMDIDNTTNNIFIGGDNILLKLSPHLEEIKRLPTGPMLDYIDCLGPSEGDCEGRNMTNNYNKALLLHYHNSTKRLLLTCGSVKHGVCQLRNVDSLLDESRSEEFVVSNARQPAVVLITPWDEPALQKHALYVGTSWHHRYDGPVLKLLTACSVSTRNIDGNDIFEVSETSRIEGSSSLEFKSGNLNYLVKFIYGFSSGDFNYFVTVQETTESFEEELKQEVLKTFIIRICQQDIHYKTYIELPVECQSSGKNYNRAQSGYLTKRGDLYSKSSRLQAPDDVLIVTFSESTAGWNGVSSQTSAICLYPVKEINEAMASEQQKCVNGTYQGLTLGLPWTPGGEEKCEREGLLQITPEYCPKQFPKRFPHPFRGKKSLDKQAILEHSKGLLTAVTAMPYYNHTVMFLGTDKGQLLKASLQNVGQKVEPYRELSIGVKEVRQIKLTGDYKYLVVLSADKVTKLPVEECSLSSTCSECVQLKDPFCGWCTLYKKCSQIQDCHQVEIHPLKFVSDEAKCVKFASISPEKIPHDGNVVDIGYLSFPMGMLKYYKVETDDIVWIGVAAGIAVAVIIFIVVLCWCQRRSRKQKKKYLKSLEVQMNNLKSRVAHECREAFAELQTDVTDLTSDLSTSGMPILDFKTYALHVLFPGLNDHPVLNKNKALLGENWEKGLLQFSELIYTKKFLLVFIRTLESQHTFQMKDRFNVASLLMVTLQARMEYATEILKDLLCELLRKTLAKSHPALFLKRTQSVAEKMLTNWLAFCMYHFLKKDAGEPLFMLFKAVKQQVEKGPVDAVTGEARYSLSEDKLLRQAVDFKPLGVSVTYNGSPAVAVVLLDCDTISQAKEKILDVVFKNSPFSSRPPIDVLRLEWDQSSGRGLSLRDDDSQALIEGEWRKINTLRHYQVTDNASLRLVTEQTYSYGSTGSELNKKNVRLDGRVHFSPVGSYSPLAFETTDGPDEGGRLWHLVKQLNYPTDSTDDDCNSKFVSEVYLTRLLNTKGNIQQFVDRLFHTVFMRNCRGGSSLPPVIKVLFDLLDAQAKELNLTDPEVLRTWKNNSFPVRFWINIIKNPTFIFDVCKSTIVDSCLSVIAQLFMDSFSVSEQVLGKDSPSNKLLYAREIPGYRQEVERFYADIQASPAPTPEELSRFFTDLSTEHGQEFNADHALQELYDYVKRYQDQLQEALEDSELSSLASKLEHVIATISDD